MPAPLFSSVLCGTNASAAGYAARRQGERLASPGGPWKCTSATALIRLDPAALAARCAGHDLLVVAAPPGAERLLAHAPIPTLLARWQRAGPAALSERILVVVRAGGGAEEAADLAGRIAARHGGNVTLLVAPRRDAALERALNASERIVAERTATLPEIIGRPPALEHDAEAACRSAAASLLVIGARDSGIESRTAEDVATRVACSVLAIPVLSPLGPDPAPADGERRTEFESAGRLRHAQARARVPG